MRAACGLEPSATSVTPAAPCRVARSPIPGAQEFQAQRIVVRILIDGETQQLVGTLHLALHAVVERAQRIRRARRPRICAMRPTRSARLGSSNDEHAVAPREVLERQRFLERRRTPPNRRAAADRKRANSRPLVSPVMPRPSLEDARRGDAVVVVGDQRRAGGDAPRALGVEHQCRHQILDVVDAEAPVVQRRVAQRQAGLRKLALEVERLRRLRGTRRCSDRAGRRAPRGNTLSIVAVSERSSVLVHEDHVHPLDEHAIRCQVIVRELHELARVEMRGAGRPRMRGLRHDGVVAAAR